MDEIQLDSFIEEIGQEMELLRVLEREKPELTDPQKEELKKLSPSERSAQKKAYLKEANERKKDRFSLLISALEEKIQNANLPSEAKAKLHGVVNRAKDLGWRFSPDALQEVERIKQEDLSEQKKNTEQQQNNEFVGSVLVGAAIGAASVVAVNTLAQKAVKEPERVEKITHFGNKTLEKLQSNESDISLALIASATGLFPIEKRYAKAAFMESHPAIRQDKMHEVETLKKTAIQKSIERHKRRHQNYRSENKRPEYLASEALVMKRVNRIKQHAGTALTMDEIKAELKHPALIRIYEARMRQDHPEFFKEQDKAEHKKDSLATLRSVRRHYRQHHLKTRLAMAQEKPVEETETATMAAAHETKRFHNRKTAKSQTLNTMTRRRLGKTVA